MLVVFLLSLLPAIGIGIGLSPAFGSGGGDTTPPSGGDGTQLDFSESANSGHIVTVGL